MNAYQELEAIFEKMSHLNHLQAIANWDEAVMMPPGGGKARAQAMSILQGMLHEILTQDKVKELIEKAKELNLNNTWQQANLYWMEKCYRHAVCLPTALVREITETRMESEQAWRILRADNNWQDFAPLLKKNIELVKKSAKIRAEIFQLSPYDVLIDEYSPGITQKIINPIFNQLKIILPELIAKITQKQTQPIIPQGYFAPEKQKQIGLQLMQALGFDFNHGRLDVSHHPFCGGVPQDTRITTRYSENEFITALMGICHETGHARYEQNLPEKWLLQPVGMALGMAVHESQSLLIEMQACRSTEFMQFLSPLVKLHFGEQEAFSPENLFQLYTFVKPNFIRVDADEVTYPLHIILRYEIEKELIENDLVVDELPDIWDAKMKKYLGLSTKGNYKDGVMQDVHWPCGLFGYFPAYTLGRLIAAQLYTQALKTHPKICQQLKQGDFSTLNEWLKHHVHARASSVKFEKLMLDATGEPLNSEYFIKHIQQRYGLTAE